MKIFERSEALQDVKVRALTIHRDERGWLAEMYRADEIDHRVAMSYLSWTKSGFARGPHEHLLQADCFAFVGPGMFRLYLWDHRVESPTHMKRMRLDVGETNPVIVLVPPRVVHAYKCISLQDGMVINLPDKLYRGIHRRTDVDEVRHEERPDSPFVMD